MKILNFGSCNIDYVYSLDHIVKVGETETTYKMNIFPGGKGLNQSIAAAKAGITIYHAGCVGEDGDMLTSLMAESGVDTAFVKKTSGKNGHAIIQVSAKGENSIFLFPGSNEKVSIEFSIVYINASYANIKQIQPATTINPTAYGIVFESILLSCPSRPTAAQPIATD